jgi:hypothetical protein
LHLPALPGDREQALLDGVGERRGGDVEAEFDGRGHLVDVLAAGPGGAHEPFVDLAEQTEISKIAAHLAPSRYISTPLAALVTASVMAEVIRPLLMMETTPNASMNARHR